jgi:hypothetical protein
MEEFMNYPLLFSEETKYMKIQLIGGPCDGQRLNFRMPPSEKIEMRREFETGVLCSVYRPPPEGPFKSRVEKQRKYYFTQSFVEEVSR